MDKLIRRMSYRHKENNNKMIEGEIRKVKNASERVKGDWDGTRGENDKWKQEGKSA